MFTEPNQNIAGFKRYVDWGLEMMAHQDRFVTSVVAAPYLLAKASDFFVDIGSHYSRGYVDRRLEMMANQDNFRYPNSKP